jgi:hypothetical protein
MAFGVGAYFYIENGYGREVSRDEAVAILKSAVDSGLVLQPGNGQKVWNMCMCCGCCRGLLRALKKFEKPAADGGLSCASGAGRGAAKKRGE